MPSLRCTCRGTDLHLKLFMSWMPSLRCTCRGTDLKQLRIKTGCLDNERFLAFRMFAEHKCPSTRERAINNSVFTKLKNEETTLPEKGTSNMLEIILMYLITANCSNDEQNV